MKEIPVQSHATAGTVSISHLTQLVAPEGGDGHKSGTWEQQVSPKQHLKSGTRFDGSA